MAFVALRTNGDLLKTQVGSTVRVIGRVIDTNNGFYTIETSNGSSARVTGEQQESQIGQFIEVIGKVQNDLSVEQMSALRISDGFGEENNVKREAVVIVTIAAAEAVVANAQSLTLHAMSLRAVTTSIFAVVATVRSRELQQDR